MGFLRIGSGGGLLVALILNILALSTPGWRYTNDQALGLFKSLSDKGWSDLVKTDAEKVALAFNLMGDVILLCGAIAVLIAGVGKDYKKILGKVGGVLAMVAAIFIMIGMASYTGLYEQAVGNGIYDWGYSFVFGWISFCLAFIGSIVAIAGK